MIEYWDVYDSQKRRTGKKILRSDCESLVEDEFHLVVSIWIYNDDGKFLIQKRALSKDHGGMWADTGGAALFNETSEEAIIRETKEEIGVELVPDELILLCTQRIENDKHRYFRDVYIAHKNVDIDTCVLDSNEVAEVQWASLDQIVKMMKDGQFFVPKCGYIDKIQAYMEELESQNNLNSSDT